MRRRRGKKLIAVMLKVEREGRCGAGGANHAELVERVRERRRVGERDQRSTAPDGLEEVWSPARVPQPEGEVVVLGGNGRDILAQGADAERGTTEELKSARMR